MKHFRVAFLSLCLVLTLILCSCEGVFDAGNETLIEPPVMFEEQKEIKSALTLSVGDKITLEYPKTGSNRSAFLLFDLNGDEKNEAIAFYRPATSDVEGDIVHINILENTEKEGWISVCDTVGEATSIDRVSTGIFGGKNGVVIGWDLIRDREKTLVCYSLNGKKLERNFTAPYIEFAVADFWLQNEGQELITVNYNPTDEKLALPTQHANLIIRKQSGFEKISSTALDLRVTGYKSCTSGFYNEEKMGFFLDGTLDATSVNTQILTVNSAGELLNPLLREGKTDDNNIHKATLLTQDINGDGILEVPHPEILNGYEDVPESEKIYKTVWKNLVSGRLKKSQTMFISSFGIRIGFTENMEKSLTIKPITARNELVFYEYNNSLEESDTELFRIMVSEKEGFELEEGYEILKSTEYTVVSVKITAPENENCLTWGTLYEITQIV